LDSSLGVSGQKAIRMWNAAERRRKYYIEEDGGFPQVRAMVSLVNPRSPVTCPNTKSALENKLTNLLVGWMHVQVSN
jgi:hypothetical protein